MRNKIGLVSLILWVAIAAAAKVVGTSATHGVPPARW